MMTAIAVVYFATIYIGVPYSLFRGWSKYRTVLRDKTIPGWIAVASLSLATLSVALAIGSLLGGPWRYYDPTLMRIYSYGTKISFIALVLGLAVIWKQTALRWLAPLAALGTLIFWIGAAAME